MKMIYEMMLHNDSVCGNDSFEEERIMTLSNQVIDSLI